MKAAILSALVGWCVVAHAAPYVPPTPTRWVTDNAGFLSAATRTEIDNHLEAYQQQTGHQVIVWIGQALPGNEPIDDFAARVFATWGIGKKKVDDGVALFVIPATHDVRIEVGYGLEDKLGDLESKRILTEVVVPEIQAGHNDDAISKGITRIIAELGSDSNSNSALPTGAATQGSHVPFYWWIIGGIVLVVLIGACITHPQLAWFLFDIISSFGSSGGGSSWGGGSSSGGGGGGFSGGGGRSGGGGASAKW